MEEQKRCGFALSLLVTLAGGTSIGLAAGVCMDGSWNTATRLGRKVRREDLGIHRRWKQRVGKAAHSYSTAELSMRLGNWVLWTRGKREDLQRAKLVF